MSVVQLVMVLLALLGGGVVLYLVAWVIVPVAEEAGVAAGTG
jgi:phage shock protein PspC (stress-responsive transcriptional regulator)